MSFFLRLSAAALLLCGLSGCRPGLPTSTLQQTAAPFQRAAYQLDIRGLQVLRRPDGGLGITGTLRGNAFAVRVPPNWNGQSVVWAHGYQPLVLREWTPNPFKEPFLPVLNVSATAPAYAQGFATANSAYAKTGYAVREGAEATHTLSEFLRLAGVSRQYIIGASMGGNVTVSLIERYPGEYAGALTLCGVTPGWASEVRFLMDVQLVYRALTRDTPYALPDWLDPAEAGFWDMVKVTALLRQLFEAAEKGDPRAQGIVRQVAQVTGIRPELSAFLVPLSMIGDILADHVGALGGLGYSNVDRVYRGSDNDAELNRRIRRVNSPLSSMEAIARNYTATGRFETPLLSLHSAADPLVPDTMLRDFAELVGRSGNPQRLVTRLLGPKTVLPCAPLPTPPVHCSFSQAELDTAWNDLRHWVEEGERPQ